MSIPLFLLSFNKAKLSLNASEFTQSLVRNLPKDPCDLYVFGFQELCSTLDGCFRRSAEKHLMEVNRVLLHALRRKYTSSDNTSYNFTTVGMHNAGAIAIVAITPFALKFSTPRFADASCGYASTLTKGAVGLRISYVSEETFVTELTFVNAHLCALEGEARYQRRLQDVYVLMRALDFGDNYNYLKPNSHAFFMGDLNFRTSKTGNSPVQELLDLPHDPDVHPKRSGEKQTRYMMSLVKKYDELTAAREDGEIFSGFDEALIAFNPTYKYHVGTAIYNNSRSPLWCDRILYQSTYRCGIDPVVHKYASIPRYLRLDHRPVFLHISIPTEAPVPIVDHNGHLMLLAPTQKTGNKSPILIDGDNEAGSHTKINMRSTAFDKIKQNVIRRVSDTSLGYALWFSTTSSGRLVALPLALFAWLYYYFF